MMNRFEIIFQHMGEVTAVAVQDGRDDADMAEIRTIREESDAIQAIMRVSREISQQTHCGCFTSS
jgi:hypothetical protein